MLGALTSLTGGGSFQGGSAGPSAVGGNDTQEYSGGNVGLTIAPSGVNIGSILQPFNGSPENGGYGLSMASRLQYLGGNSVIDAMPITGGGQSNLMLYAGIAMGGLAVVYLLFKRR